VSALSTSEVIGIRPVNSVDFVRAAFEVHRSGRVAAILRHAGPEFNVAETLRPAPGGGWLEIRQRPVEEDRPAQIVFTSGTEGAPKAILLSHRALTDVVLRLNAIMGLDETVSEYVGVPVTYSFGFARCRAVAAVGGRCFIPERGFNPAELARMLADQRVNAVSAVPTLWRTVLAQPEVIGAAGERVKWIEIGSQYMSREEKEGMKALFPNAVIVQHYGLTEASRTTFLDISETEGELLESVGRATGNAEVAISPAGRILVRGPHLASGEIVVGALRGLADADGWYTTGDFGRLDGAYLFYEGRADDQINCGGIKISPDLLERRISQRLSIDGRVAVARVSDSFRGDGVFVAVDASAGLAAGDVEAAAREGLQSLGVDLGSALTVQVVPHIPRTDTGKVRRKDLAALHATSGVPVQVAPAAADSDSLAGVFARVFPGREIAPTATFRTLGGDSLNYVQMLVLLERRLGALPRDWERTPIAQLEAAARGAPRASVIGWVEPSVFLRVAAIVGVVATHGGAEVLGGGTLLLVALIGYNTARFKWTDLIHGEVWPWIKSYAAALLVPYYVVLALYLMWNRSFEVDQILLSANLIEARTTRLFPFWFVQVLLQSLVLFGLLFSAPPVRRWAARAPTAFAFTVLAGLIAVRGAYPLVWDTTVLNDLVPPRFMAILWLGACFYIAENPRQRLWLCLAGVGFAFLDKGWSPMAAWLILGSVVLGLARDVPVPAFARPAFHAIGAATFSIFIFNGIAIWLTARLFGVEAGPMLFLAGMLGPLALWWMVERVRRPVTFTPYLWPRTRRLPSPPRV
jgi:acyl-coenzyme A synthetase/AMP-(fatty) acid ligase